MPKQSGVVLGDKRFLVYKDEDQAEITIRLSDRKGLIVSVYLDERGDVEVRVMKTVHGCPGVGKPEFSKLYNK